MQLPDGLVGALNAVDVVVSTAVDVVAAGGCLRAGRVEIHNRLSKLAVGIPCCQEYLTDFRGGIHI